MLNIFIEVLPYVDVFLVGWVVGWIVFDYAFFNPQRELLKGALEAWANSLDLLARVIEDRSSGDSVVSPIQIKSNE